MNLVVGFGGRRIRHQAQCPERNELGACMGSTKPLEAETLSRSKSQLSYCQEYRRWGAALARAGCVRRNRPRHHAGSGASLDGENRRHQSPESSATISGESLTVASSSMTVVGATTRGAKTVPGPMAIDSRHHLATRSSAADQLTGGTRGAGASERHIGGPGEALAFRPRQLLLPTMPSAGVLLSLSSPSYTRYVAGSISDSSDDSLRVV